MEHILFELQLCIEILILKEKSNFGYTHHPEILYFTQFTVNVTIVFQPNNRDHNRIPNGHVITVYVITVHVIIECEVMTVVRKNSEQRNNREQSNNRVRSGSLADRFTC